ncbi:sacsin-like [Limosa lapponica baueri]|uniref:Sacsin-like n=1 Tax=Limosa lapponica baueri TaxID=1758121 RepID=A0A2I0U6F0_LIMLA|nr:sacsin-like [Limosa lapponica baueri]
MALEKPKVEAFCQRAPTFLDYLHNILQKYPDGGQILKELVQNADDAGANEVVFVSDEREFDVTGGGLAGTQGPALLAYNDAPMSPRDWTGLMSPGVSHKREDPSTVGRFGLGFTSVYHLTDLPGVLSPPSLGVLDPECQGTLFRFPLRRQPSGIAAGVSDPERLRSLLQTFLTEAPLALLFLRHVRRPPGDEGLSLTWCLMALHGDGVGDGSEWLVATGRATEGPVVALGSEMGCCPELSLAHPLRGTCRGRLCCFLPLPATDETATGLPVHASAPFALSDDRRHLRWPEEGEEGEKDARWNALLLLGLLPRVYSHMAGVATALPEADAYSIWPDPDCTPSSGRIRSLVTNVCRELATARTLVPATQGATGRLRAPEAVLLPEAAGDTATRRVVQALLVAAGEPVVEVPAHVRRALALGMAEGMREATAGHVREVLRRHGAAALPAADRLSLLRYVAGDGCHAELQGLPLLPRADGTFVAFGTASDTVYVDTSNCPRELLPGLAGSFLPSDLEPGLDSLLRGVAKAGLFPNMVLLDPAVTAQTLRLALPSTWTSLSSSPAWEDQCLPPAVASVLEEAAAVASRLATLPAADVDTLRLYLADIPSLTEQDRATLAALPLFSPLPCLAAPQPTELCRDEADRRLLERLQRSLISAAHVALEATRAVACGAYAGRPAETQALLLWVLQHGDVLFAQSPPLQQACSTLAFLETPKGPRCPQDLYDPCESTLQALLGPERFPPAAFHSPPVLRALRALGLRHGEGCLLPSDILEAAASCTGKPGQPFLPPKELRSTQYQPLVGLAMHLTDAFVPEAEKKLGLSETPPPERENLKTFGAAPHDAVVWTGTGCLFRAWGVEARVPEGSGFALRPAASTVYLDMELEAEEDVQEVVHEAVPASTAIFLGTELLSTRVLGLEPFTACGPSEPITLRLRNILREYGEEGDIFTEMVQNAEDAGATVCRFLLDLRCHRKATSGLLDPGMAACHGPALWAYNNALFTEDDFQNITRVGAATKEGRAGQIGRFGLGFNSVYRVTDVPAVLSGETLLIFDPNGTHLSKHVARAGSPGIRLDFSSRPRILRAFAEQFWPYHGIFGCRLPEPGPFPGSLFRLPFRTEEEAVTSQVCSQAFGTERIKSLGASFLGSNRLLLLFLRGVREMSLEMLPDTATSAEDTVPLATLRRKEIRDLGAPGEPPSWAAIEQLTARGKWVPHLDAEEGQVFCHLPMPVASGLPIHVHGAFSILSNRKGLWDTAERGEWNRVLLRNAVPAAWLRALDHLRTMHEAGELETYEYHVFWPDTNTAHYPFTEAVTGFYQAVAARDGPRLFSDGCSWCSLRDARFLHQAVIRHPTLGALAKRVFTTTLPRPLLPVALPEQVRRGLGKAVDAGTYDWPRFYCELVLPNLKDLSVVDRDALLLHALDMSHDDVNKVLQTVPCIPATPHGHLQLISCLVHPRGRTASLYDPKDGRFPTGDAFLSAERLSQLERLGMVRDTVTLPELLERAKTVQLLWTEDRAQGCRRAACILELLRDAVKERVNNTVQAAFQTVPFLPGTLPTGEHVLLPAAQLYHHLNAPLAGLIHPILDPKVLGENFSLPEDVASFLGLDRQPPAATVLQQLQALSGSSNALPLENLQDSTHRCYMYLNGLLQRDHSIWDEVASAVSQGEPFILVGSRFMPVMAVAQKLLFEASPYLHQLPEQYLTYRKLWECVGLRHTFAWDDYAQVLCSLAKTHAGERLPAAELDLALRLVSCGLMAEDKEPDAYQIQQLFLPDQEGILHPRDRLHFNDTPWLPLDKDVLLCHEKLSRVTALRCGVPTTRHRAVERSRLPTADLSLWAQPFGAHEDLTTRLKNILAEYPACSCDMVTELLQNADDAGARLVHFVWDRRQHPAHTTFSEKWNDLQGPALCFYSDSPFQQQDIEGIQRLGVGGKQGRQDVTGRYGLGFSTVFHFTDCPAFLTGDSALCVFDPHQWYVPTATTESPGGMFAVNPEFKRTFPDIYGTFLPSLFNLNQGVLFRMPLRTAAGAAISKVSPMAVRDQDIRDMETVLAEKGEELVLFLRHLRTVVFSEIPPDGKPMLEKLRVATELTDGDAELREDFQARLSQTRDGHRPISASYIMTVKNSKTRASTVWRVISQIGVQEGAEESPVHGRLPYGAVAGCLKPLGLADLVTGKAFCTLPLPVTTGLPVHINANFSVDAARRNLRQDKGSREAAWNSFLLRHLVAPLYCAFLTRQRKALGPEGLQFKGLKDCQQHLASRYLRFFPAVGKGAVTPTFQEMVRDAYRHLSQARLPLVPVYHVKPSDSMVTMTWASPGGGDVLTEPYFLMEKPEPDLQEVLQHLKMNLVPPFTDLQKIYEEFVAAQVEAVAFQPASLRRFLKALALPVPSVLADTPLRTPKSCSVLLKKCLELGNVAKEELERLPLLATEDGRLNALSIQQPVFHNKFAHLFPRHCHHFAHNELNSDLLLPDFVKELSLLEAKPFIQEALGQLNWTAGGEKWLEKLWVFFSTVVYRDGNKKEELEANMKSFMDHIQDMVVLPVQDSKTGLKSLLPLSFLPKVLHQCETDVDKVLHKLGIPVLQKSLLPFCFAFFCLNSRTLQATEPRAVLAQLADTRDHLHWKDLKKKDVNCLLRFVQGKLDSVARDQLRLLPLFRKYGGDYVAVAPYCKVLVLSKQCPELPKGAEALYSLEEGMLLLTADEIHQDMAKDLKWELTDGRKLFKTVVLPRLSQFTARECMEALRLFFALQTILDDEFTEDVVAAFKTVAFIPDAGGVPRLASYFYTEMPSFCILRLQHRFVPESFFAELRCKQRVGVAMEFLLKVGVRKSLSEEDFVALALQIEREATQARCHTANLLERQKEMLRTLLGDTLPLSKDFLQKIASIRFLPPLDIPPDLINLHPPFAACTKAVALKGSVYHCREDVAELLWTTATILPKSLTLKKELLKAIGVLVEIPTALVVANLEQVCRAACQTQQKVNTRASVLQKVYNFLHTRLEEVDAGRLAELPVVLAKSGKMTRPRQVVLSSLDEAGFYPYLLKPNRCIVAFEDLLQHLGVVPHPTLAHYSYVLAQIHQESRGSGTLDTLQKKTALLATRYFFQLLQDAQEPPDSSTVADLYLLSTADRLEPSHKLYFNDCVSSSTSKALEKTFVFMAELPESRCNTRWLLQKLPQHLRPQALSEVTEQQLEEGSLRPCRYSSLCSGQRRLQTLLVSPWFRMGLEALLRWQSHRSMVRTEGDGGFRGEQLKVQCCEDIRTVLIHRGAKLEGSSQPRVIHVCLAGGAQRLLYIRHAETVLDRHQLRVLDTLAQEINVILGGQLEAPALSVLREMLVCQEPRDVAFVLEENDVPLVGAALEPELEKKLQEEAVAKGKPWKDQHSLMPEVNGNSLATLGQLCAVKRPKQGLYLQHNTASHGHGSWLCNKEAMTPTPSIPEAQRWLRQAESDLQAAHNDIRHCCPNWVLFKVHQALEKALVAAALCHAEAFEAPVELVGLARWLEAVEPKLRGLAEEVEALRGCGVDGKATQYPSYHPFPVIPSEAFGSADEEEVLKRVQGVLGRLQDHLGRM